MRPLLRTVPLVSGLRSVDVEGRHLVNKRLAVDGYLVVTHECTECAEAVSLGAAGRGRPSIARHDRSAAETLARRDNSRKRFLTLFFYSATDTGQFVTVVPEPSRILLTALALVALLAHGRSRA